MFGLTGFSKVLDWLFRRGDGIKSGLVIDKKIYTYPGDSAPPSYVLVVEGLNAKGKVVKREVNVTELAYNSAKFGDRWEE